MATQNTTQSLFLLIMNIFFLLWTFITQK